MSFYDSDADRLAMYGAQAYPCSPISSRTLSTYSGVGYAYHVMQLMCITCMWCPW